MTVPVVAAALTYGQLRWLGAFGLWSVDMPEYVVLLTVSRVLGSMAAATAVGAVLGGAFTGVADVVEAGSVQTAKSCRAVVGQATRIAVLAALAAGGALPAVHTVAAQTASRDTARAGWIAAAVGVVLCLAVVAWPAVRRGVLIWVALGMLSDAVLVGGKPAISHPDRLDARMVTEARFVLADGFSVMLPFLGGPAVALFAWCVLLAVVLSGYAGRRGDGEPAATLGALVGPLISTLAFTAGMAYVVVTDDCVNMASGDCDGFASEVVLFLQLVAFAVLAAVSFGTASVGRALHRRAARRRLTPEPDRESPPGVLRA